jgi:hypothetical protein
MARGRNTMATKSAAAQSGVFVVDLSGLNLSKSALQGMEKAINSTVQKQLATLDLRIGSGGIIGKRPEWYGLWVIQNIIQQTNR